MPRRAAEEPLRTKLVEAAARLLATEGAQAMTLRRVAADAGTSTMAIYTHFGGMAELRRAVRAEGFTRLDTALAAHGPTDDPVADLLALCTTYYERGVADPDLYRVMFMVARCIDEGRFASGDPVALATEVWVAGHGILTLQLAGALSPDAARATVDGILGHLIAAFGASP
jgi:AcrR family transcriptional regulator